MLPSQRALFDIPREVCYLNAASYSPLPLRTLEAGRAAVGRKGKPWTLAAGFAGEQHERARLAAARLINADPADIALIPSISYGVATAAQAVDHRPRHARDRFGKRSFLPGPGMATPGRTHRAFPSRPCAAPMTATGPRRFSRRSKSRARRQSVLPRFRRCTGRRWTDRRRQGWRLAAAAGRQIPDRRDTERRRAGNGREAPRSGLRDLPDLQMADRAIRPRLSVRCQTPSGWYPARADRGCPPQRARRERCLFR